jgi:hypothetical protein
VLAGQSQAFFGAMQQINLNNRPGSGQAPVAIEEKAYVSAS